MNQQTYTYCGTCAKDILSNWQGWPHHDPIPPLPRIINDVCESCGLKSEPLINTRITWFNVHGENNSGLPDYWLLVIDGQRKKWGLPYFTEGDCPACSQRTTISQMNFPNGTSELKHNCSGCGIRSCANNSQERTE